jgi:hypothetical protein
MFGDNQIDASLRGARDGALIVDYISREVKIRFDVTACKEHASQLGCSGVGPKDRAPSHVSVSTCAERGNLCPSHHSLVLEDIWEAYSDLSVLTWTQVPSRR